MHIGAGVLAHFWTPWLAIFAGRLVYIQHTIQLDSTEWRWNVAWTEFSRYFLSFFSLFSLSRAIYISPQWRTCPFRAKERRPLPPPPICCHTGREFKKLLQHSTHVTDVLYTTWRRQQHTHSHTTIFVWSFPGTTLDAFVFSRLLFFDFLFFRSLFAQLWKSQLDVRPKNSQVYPHWYTRTLNWWWPHTCSDVHNSYLYIRVGYI